MTDADLRAVINELPREVRETIARTPVGRVSLVETPDHRIVVTRVTHEHYVFRAVSEPEFAEFVFECWPPDGREH